MADPKNDPGHRPGCPGAAWHEHTDSPRNGARRRKCQACGVVHVLRPASDRQRGRRGFAGGQTPPRWGMDWDA